MSAVGTNFYEILTPKAALLALVVLMIRGVQIIVVGCGRVGTELVQNLERLGHEVTMVDKSPRALNRLKGFSGKRVSGFGFDHATLIDAGIKHADALAAVTSGDNSNIVIARVAREHFGLDRVVARIQDPARASIYERLGVMTVPTVTWANEQFIRRLVPNHAEADWVHTTGSVVLCERELPDAWIGRPLRELDQPGKLNVVAVTRMGEAELIQPNSFGQGGDRIHVIARAHAIASLDRSLEEAKSR